MTPLSVIFLALSIATLFCAPRKWALLPLITGACYMTQGQQIELGSFTFTFIRILVAIGLVRVVSRGERLPGGVIGLDFLIVLWAIWACISSQFHTNPTSDLVYKLGYAYDVCGFYFLIRFLCSSNEDVVRLSRILIVALIPVALAMVNEQRTGHNIFSVMGGVPEMSMIRDGRIRSCGSFRHPILAGTVGAVTLALITGLRKQLGGTFYLGVVTCVTMIIASASSGPILAAMAAFGALCLYPLRNYTYVMRGLAIVVYIVLDVTMTDPAYFMIARMDVTGSSTGWHRARLIQSSFEHVDEWWLGGTDYTRHWMPSGVSWSPDHSDITNQYIKMGVIGGLPLMFLYIALLVAAFRYVGKGLRRFQRGSHQDRFVLWTLGSMLFAHSANFLSVHYFDQSALFIYLTLAAIGSLVHRRVTVAAKAKSPARVEAVVWPYENPALAEVSHT